MSIVIERDFFLANHSGPKGGCRRTMNKGVEPMPAPATPSHRILRISKLMALAIRCDQLLRSGVVPDATALARLARVSQPRMTQILNLTLLASDVQEKMLFLDSVKNGRPEVTEKWLRTVCSIVSWREQRDALRRLAIGIHGAIDL